jgi:hypothetical protein
MKERLIVISYEVIKQDLVKNRYTITKVVNTTITKQLHHFAIPRVF